MTSGELREKFLNFFKEKGHTIIPSASLIPENDPTVLFTTAGMHPLVPFLLGEKHPSGKRLTSCQKCIRTGDIDDVGDDTHLTFFEMLGNWSLGDYWKEDAIKWSFEFLTKELGITLDRLAITCFAGDNDAPKDEESAKIWESLGVKKERIAFLGKEDNWWGPAGQTGPCGPDTEMFYWKLNDKKAPKKFDPKDKNWVEIWNDVFMQYVKDENGRYNTALQKNVDTGMGLERTLAVLNGKENIYETDLFEPIIKLIPAELEEKKKRIIADHSKAINALLDAGVMPSNKERGYVLRRLMRRIIAYEFLSKKDFLGKIISSTVFAEERKKFLEILHKEFRKFTSNISNFSGVPVENIKEINGLPFNKVKTINGIPLRKILSGKDAFTLFSTYGFPIEVLIELAGEEGVGIDTEGFREEVKKHQELSRTASAGVFKGGLADASEETTKLHTAAHIMLAGLRKLFGNDVIQKGSNITAERLRFDFTRKEKMTSEQIKDVENFVNDIIKKDLPVVCEEMPLDKARELNAMGVFESKYGDKVKVYTIGSGGDIVSREICGGPHVERTGILGHFRIQKEESSSSGVRRIKAVLE